MSEQLLVPTEVYLKSGIHIGTKYKTKYMEDFIYKTRPDGLSILNLEKIDQRLKIAAKLLSNYEPEEILIVGRRESAWKPILMFKKITGCQAFIGRYPPGVLTNTNLKNFTEAGIMIVTDPWTDKNAVNDALKVGIPIIGLCDTNNQTNNIDFVLPCNNKGKKSLALIFWILAREYLKLKGRIKNDKEFKYSYEEFIQE